MSAFESTALIGDKQRETCLRWFKHVQCRLTMARMRKVFLCRLIAPQGKVVGRIGYVGT